MPDYIFEKLPEFGKNKLGSLKYTSAHEESKLEAFLLKSEFLLKLFFNNLKKTTKISTRNNKGQSFIV